MRYRAQSVTMMAVLLLSLAPRDAVAQLESARGRIEQIAAGISGRVGVAVVDIETGECLTVDGAGKYPMQSVFKFPLALAILDRVDDGTFTLGQNIHIRKSELLPDTWSPMRDKYPEGNIDLTLAEVIRFTVSESDNNACDILFRLVGGPKAVEEYVHALGVTQIAIVSTEREMHRESKLQYDNWSSPAGMAELLRKFFNGEVLSEESTSFLREIMEETTTGPRKIKGLLPTNAVVAHKTGFSGADEQGLIAATNDVGVLTFPSGRHAAIAVFVSESLSGEKECDKAIASIARAVWDAYIEESDKKH
jgi:beta-lactamase class A